jgi:hypothetical protein
MGEALRVSDEKMAKEIAMEAAKSMWRYTIPSSFYKVEYDQNAKSWNIEASYFEEKLTFKIDAKTGNVSALRSRRQRKSKQCAFANTGVVAHWCIVSASLRSLDSACAVSAST